MLGLEKERLLTNMEKLPRVERAAAPQEASTNRRRGESVPRAGAIDDSVQMEQMNEPIDPGRAGRLPVVARVVR